MTWPVQGESENSQEHRLNWMNNHLQLCYLEWSCDSKKKKKKGLNSKENYFLRQEMQGQYENTPRRKVFWNIKQS